MTHPSLAVGTTDWSDAYRESQRERAQLAASARRGRRRTGGFAQPGADPTAPPLLVVSIQ